LSFYKDTHGCFSCTPSHHPSPGLIPHPTPVPNPIPRRPPLASSPPPYRRCLSPCSPPPQPFLNFSGRARRSATPAGGEARAPPIPQPPPAPAVPPLPPKSALKTSLKRSKPSSSDAAATTSPPHAPVADEPEGHGEITSPHNIHPSCTFRAGCSRLLLLLPIALIWNCNWKHEATRNRLIGHPSTKWSSKFGLSSNSATGRRPGLLAT
jgi:hypothetical protein